MDHGLPGLGTVINVTAIVAGSCVGLLVGAGLGSALRVEHNLARLGERVRAGVTSRRRAPAAAEPQVSGSDQPVTTDRFVEGWLTASLFFCIGPLAILGSINDGLGCGIDQLALKSVLDGFAALTATGGLLLVGISLRLLRIRDIAVGDLLPALLVAPVLTQLVVVLR